MNIHRFTPYYVGSIHISHLLLVNNLVIIGKIDVNSITYLKKALESLEFYMGLRINYEKSSYFTNGGESAFLMDALMHINKEIFCFKNLGLPLTQGPFKTCHFNGLFDELSSWMSGWNSKILGLCG